MTARKIIPNHESRYDTYNVTVNSNGKHKTDLEFVSQLAIPGTVVNDDGRNPFTFKVAAWNGIQFEAITVTTYIRIYEGIRHREEITLRLRLQAVDEHEAEMPIYAPVDPRIILSDVEGATIVYANDTDDGWLFAHCDEDSMVDYEYELAAAVVAAFANPIDAALLKSLEATNATIRTQAIDNYRNLVMFRNDVETKVRLWCQELHIGWQEQNPHEAHLHQPILKIIKQTAASWQKNRPTYWTNISARVSAMILTMTLTHTYETRWDKAAKEALNMESEDDEV